MTRAQLLDARASRRDDGRATGARSAGSSRCTAASTPSAAAVGPRAGPRGDARGRAALGRELLHGDGLRRLIPTLPAVLHVSLTRGDRDGAGRASSSTADSNPTTSHRIRRRSRRDAPPLADTLEDLGWPDRSSGRRSPREPRPPPRSCPDARAVDPTTTTSRTASATLVAPGRPPAADRAVPPRPLQARLRLARAQGRRGDRRLGHPRPPRRASRTTAPADAALLAAGWRVLRVTYRRLRAASRRSSPRSSRRSLAQARRAPRTARCTAGRSPRPPGRR